MGTVFVSYTHADRRKAETIARAINDAGLTAWIDYREISDGDQLAGSVRSAIRDCDCLLLIHTKNTKKSKWVGPEMTLALDLQKEIHIATYNNALLPDFLPEEAHRIVRTNINRSLHTSTRERLIAALKKKTGDISRTPVVSVLNLKGGVGKTSLSANIAAGLNEFHGRSVLLIDLDPQHNLTQLLIDNENIRLAWGDFRSVLNVLNRKVYRKRESQGLKQRLSNQQVIENSVFKLKKYADNEPRIDLLLGHFGTIEHLFDEPPIEFEELKDNFRSFINGAREQYDVIVVDINPGASVLTKIALSVTDNILSPVWPDRFSRQGLQLLDALLRSIRPDLAMDKRLALFNGVERKTLSEAETSIREDASESRYKGTIMDARVAFSSKFKAKNYKPIHGNFLGGLAIKNTLGSANAKRDIERVTSELIERLEI